MLSIEIKFLNGRYHSTPWGKNVNEGMVEWPPSPFRFIRGMIDTWKRKEMELVDEKVMEVIKKLSKEPPVFYLPPASSSHKRVFLSANKADPSEKNLIFDAFVVLKRENPVYMLWNELTLNSEDIKILNSILSSMNYLGRSESWIEASAIQPETFNTPPHYFKVPVSNGDIKSDTDPIDIACIVPWDQYSQQPFCFKKGKAKKKLSFFDLICLTSKEVMDMKLSEHPAIKWETYRRNTYCFDINHNPKSSKTGSHINAVLYSIETKVAPMITETLEVAEKFRRKLMGIHKKVKGESAEISLNFSGKKINGKSAEGHNHTYYLPLDKNSDGYIDHIAVLSNIPFDADELTALDIISSLWQSKNKPDLLTIPVMWGNADNLCRMSPTLQSATPFLPTRFWKKSRGDLKEWLQNEVERELENHSIEAKLINMEFVNQEDKGDFIMKNSSLRIKWHQFRRNRKEDKPRWGYNLKLTFDRPLNMPVSIGYASHFGMGLFLPK